MWTFYLVSGKEEFIESILNVLKKQLSVSKVERNKFRFTGVNVEKSEDGIMISMEDYAKSMNVFEEARNEKAEEPLSRTEL